MRLRDALTVYRKELRETLRDRRTLAVMILLPLVLYPLVTVVVSEWVISHELERRARPPKVRLVGAPEDRAPLEEALRTPSTTPGEAPFELTISDDPFVPPPPGAGVKALGGAEAIVHAPQGFAAALEADGAAYVRVYFDAADDDSSRAKDRVDDAFAGMADRVRLRRLAARGLDPAFVDPVSIASVDLATRERLGRKEVSKTLPFFLIVMTLLGSFYPAIDLTAGEKERGTLEPLLATPMSRQAIVGGKYLTVATVSALTALLNVACMAAAGLWIARSAARAAGKGDLVFGDITSAIPWGAVGLGLVGLAGATLLFSGVMMAIASLARNFKEAQNFLTPVHMVLSIPAMVSFMPGTSLTYGTAFVPVANVTLLLKDAIAGTLLPGPALAACVAIAIFALAAMALAARIYDSERLLFAPDTPETRRPLRQRLAELLSTRARGPHELTPGEALTLYGFVAVLLLAVGAELQGWGITGLAAAQWLCIALPTVVLARKRGGGVADTLGLVRPALRDIAGAVLIGASAWAVLAFAILPIQERLFPAPPPLSAVLLRSLLPKDASLGVVLFATAITPAICEELLMRGAIARALRGNLGLIGAAFVSAVLFGVLHMSAYRFLPTFLLGLLLAAVAFRTRSTIPAMIVHALNNGAVVLLQTEEGGRLQVALAGHSLLAAAGAFVLLALGWVAVAYKRR